MENKTEQKKELTQEQQTLLIADIVDALTSLNRRISAIESTLSLIEPHLKREVH